MATGEDALIVLRSIDTTLKALLALAQRRATAAKTHTVASDRDLDSKYGDPEVKFNPRDWTGPSMKQRHLSQCPPEFLDMLAETFEYFATQADANDEKTDKGKPIADYKRQDAARARGWAARIRSGKHIQAPMPTNGNSAEPRWADDESFA